MSDFQILALDGGGIKGLFSAALLAKLEEALSIHVADHFDLITGTSTGGIIALGLGLGMRPREIVQFYVNHGAKIFPEGGLRSTIRQLFCSPKHDPAPLEKAVKECFQDKLLGSSKKRLVIPSFNLAKGEVHIFKTRHHERLVNDHKIPAWKIAMATTAAPTFFPAFRGIDKIRLVDGGVWANNPTMVGVVEAMTLLDRTRAEISALSVGTSYSAPDRPAKLDSGGIARWITSKAVFEVPFEGQSHGALGQARLLVGYDNVVRVDPVAPKGLYKLDKLNTDELIAEAAHTGRDFTRIFAEKFKQHIAEPFTPVPVNEEVAVC